jgi:hypothetical protein
MTVAEASSNFDLDTLAEFLPVLLPIFDAGFSGAKVVQILNEARNLALDEEKTLVLDVTHEGVAQHLQVHLFMDDIDAPDVYFLGSETLIAAIQGKLDEYLDLD